MEGQSPSQPGRVRVSSARPLGSSTSVSRPEPPACFPCALGTMAPGDPPWGAASGQHHGQRPRLGRDLPGRACEKAPAVWCGQSQKAAWKRQVTLIPPPGAGSPAHRCLAGTVLEISDSCPGADRSSHRLSGENGTQASVGRAPAARLPVPCAMLGTSWGVTAPWPWPWLPLGVPDPALCPSWC